tara:strand:- start:132 stop:647 length:516 start_codon:yes stop_codon:yes gene_type:complete
MITFNTVSQLTQAFLKNGETIRILNPVALMGTTTSSGPGIPLASSNVARIDFDILELTIGRQVTHVVANNVIQKSLKDISGEWDPILDPTDPDVSISAVYLDGNLWMPDTPNSTGSPYTINSWNTPDEDTLQIVTTNRDGEAVVLIYSKYSGILDKIDDLTARIIDLEANH